MRHRIEEDLEQNFFPQWKKEFPGVTLGALGQSEGEADFEPGESLEEAEDEIGIANWVDPDTGAPAEEGIPRLEDH